MGRRSILQHVQSTIVTWFLPERVGTAMVQTLAAWDSTILRTDPGEIADFSRVGGGVSGFHGDLPPLQSFTGAQQVRLSDLRGGLAEPTSTDGLPVDPDNMSLYDQIRRAGVSR